MFFVHSVCAWVIEAVSTLETPTHINPDCKHFGCVRNFSLTLHIVWNWFNLNPPLRDVFNQIWSGLTYLDWHALVVGCFETPVIMGNYVCDVMCMCPLTSNSPLRFTFGMRICMRLWMRADCSFVHCTYAQTWCWSAILHVKSLRLFIVCGHNQCTLNTYWMWIGCAWNTANLNAVNI